MARQDQLRKMDLHELYLLAENRVLNNKRLYHRRDVFLADYGSFARDHLIWVITAKIKEIVDWADYISE